MDADPIPIPSGDVGAGRSELLQHCVCQDCASDHMCHECCVVLYAHPSGYNTRSTDTSKAFKTGTVLCNKALNTSPNSNDRVEKMIEFMRWIRTHKRILVPPRFKRTCYKKCHQYAREATSTSVSKRVKSKLRKSLVYECSLILDIIENEF